jgi:hypothetical protein
MICHPLREGNMALTLLRALVVVAALALVPGVAAARGGGHGAGGSGTGSHGMGGGEPGHHDGDRGSRDDGDHDRDEGRNDDAANTGPCGMGYGWTDGRYCDEPSREVGGGATTQKAEAPAK